MGPGRLGKLATPRATIRTVGALIASVCLIGAGAAGVVGLAASPAAAVTTTTVVSSGAIFPGNPIGAWMLAYRSNTGTYSFVSGPATPPGGVGSLALSVTPATHESVYNYSYGGVRDPRLRVCRPLIHLDDASPTSMR